MCEQERLLPVIGVMFSIFLKQALMRRRLGSADPPPPTFADAFWDV